MKKITKKGKEWEKIDKTKKNFKTYVDKEIRKEDLERTERALLFKTTKYLIGGTVLCSVVSSTESLNTFHCRSRETRRLFLCPYLRSKVPFSTIGYVCKSLLTMGDKLRKTKRRRNTSYINNTE